MILWYDDNLPYEPEMLDLLKDFQREGTDYGRSKYYSNYEVQGKHLDQVPILGEYLRDFYHDSIKRMTKDLGIFGQWRYTNEYWTQLYYEGSDTHGIHSHFGNGAIVSWVHILQAPEDQDCFYFVDSKMNKMYPKDQRSNTLFCFPSWSLHGVDRLSGEGERVIVAGNINFSVEI